MLADRVRSAAGNTSPGITVESSSSSVDVSSGSGTQSVTLPGTPAQYDVYIVVTAADSRVSTLGNAAVSAGWTELYDTGGSSPSGNVLLKRMTASPDSAVSIERNSFNDTSVIILQIKGVHRTTALDAALTSATGGSGMPNPPSHTTVTANSLRIVTGHLDNDQVSGISLSGYTVVQNNNNNATAMVGYKLAATAGAEDPGAFSGSGNNQWAATHFSLRPA